MHGFMCHQQTRHPGSGEIIIVMVILVIVLMALFYPVFIPHPIEKPRQTQCAVNMRQNLIAVQMYIQDHNNRFPNKATVWQTVPFPARSLPCPTYSKTKNGYGYNASLSGKTLKSPGMPEAKDLPVLADSKAPDHLLASPADIDPRHTQKAMVGYADGHVMLLQSVDIQNVPVKEAR